MAQGIGTRTDAPTVVLHWIMVVALVVSLLTGLRIAADEEGAAWASFLDPVLLQGSVDWLHVFSASLLSIVAIAYIVFLWRAHLTSRLSLRSGKISTREGRWRAINRALYWVAFALLIAAGVTGSLMYFFPGLLPERTIAAVHQYVAWAIIVYVVAHVVAQIAVGGLRGLLRIVSPRAAYGGAALAAIAASAVAVAAVLYPLDKAVIAPLNVRHVAELPKIDGELDDTAWQHIEPVELHTTRGTNLPGGEVAVRVRGVHDGEQVAMLFEWRDSTRSQKHVPLIKTPEGWKLLQTKFDIQDEDEYYEDKFAVMFSLNPEVAGGGSSHLGPKPLADKPGAPGKRGLHFTSDGSYVDVWHWKSVRTGPLNQVDDNYFGPPMPVPDKPGARYTGGYTQDPKTGGGFEQNYKKLEGTPYVEPKWLPRDFPQLAARMGTIDLDPNVGDSGQWWMMIRDTVPYSKELDDYAVGTVLPSIVIDKPFTGDRGDVTAVASWKGGWWRLETVRKIGAGSKFDVALDNGTFMWVSVFDHTQTRHSRHLHPLKLVLK
ncbi:MAG: ethylbenzene dehydrogenase-related protein [Burkholderiales bacterium]